MNKPDYISITKASGGQKTIARVSHDGHIQEAYDVDEWLADEAASKWAFREGLELRDDSNA